MGLAKENLRSQSKGQVLHLSEWARDRGRHAEGSFEGHSDRVLASAPVAEVDHRRFSGRAGGAYGRRARAGAQRGADHAGRHRAGTRGPLSFTR